MFEAAGPVRAQFLLGRAHYEAALFAPAEESFLEVLRLDPAFPGVHLELGKVYISLRRTDDAIRELELALQQSPGDADANYFLGGLLVQAGRYAEGIPYLNRAKMAKPDFWAPYFYLGKAELRLEHPAAAVEQLQRAVRLYADDASSYSLLGQALRACGRGGGSAPGARQAARAAGRRAQSRPGRGQRGCRRPLASRHTYISGH